MATSYTSLLGLALPVQGELSGTWGDVVNNYITSYVDSAVAGTQIISGSLTAVTLSVTNGSALSQAGSGATGSSQYQIIRCSGNPASLLTITAPAASKVYLIINATSTAQSVKIVGVGPTTGVTIATGKGALVAWNGSDFVTVASNDASVITGVLAAANGGTGQSSYAVGDILYASTTTALSKLADVATGSALISGGVGVAPSYGKIGLTTHVSGTLPVANGGTGATTLTANNVILGNGTSAPLFVAPGSSGNVLTSNGTTWTSSAVTAGLSGVTQSVSPFETSLGYQAGNVTTGVNNTWVGYQAGLLNTTATNNTAIGWSALKNSTGNGNTASGSNAMFSNTSGVNNTAVGGDALKSNTTANSSVAVGYAALSQNTTGAQNTAIGGSALYSNTTASENTAVGFQALNANTTGASNVAMGNNALAANTTASNNTAVGYTAGVANTTGSITAVGYGALRANTSGAQNTAVGLVALGGNTTGTNNSALGEYALFSNTTGYYNAAFGDGAMYTTSTGYQNSAFGSRALYSNTTGASNTAIGNAALQSNTTASNNTGVGFGALNANTTGASNTAVGYGALLSNSTGASNTSLGYQAGYANTTGSNNIIVGYAAEASSATVSNEVTIGATTITSTRLRGMVELNAAMLEAATISATAATGTINYDARTQSVLYYTSNASANWTLNIRASSTVSLNTAMTTGESMTIAFLVTNGATAYYQTGFQVDGSAVTPKWQGGTAPTSGNANSIDTYVITVIKTASATFTVLAAQTKFA